MPIESQSNQFKPVLLGDSLIAKIYDGSNLVFDQETFPPVWVGNYSPDNVNFYALTFHDNLFVALGTNLTSSNYFIYTSPDGFVWTKRFETQRYLQAVVGYNGFIVTADRNDLPTYFYSSDGITWTESFYFPSDADICYDNYGYSFGTLTNDVPNTLTRTGNMLAVLGSDNAYTRFVFSYNGFSNSWGMPCNVTAYNGSEPWPGSNLFAGNYASKPIIYDPSTNSVGVFGNPGFTGQTTGQFYFSQIGNNAFTQWTRRGIITGSLNFSPKGYAANGSQIAVIGSQKIIGTVDGGNNWVVAANEPPSPVTWRCVTYGNGVFMAAGEGDYVAYSPDSVNWFYIPVLSMTADTLPCFSARAIAYGKNRYVIVGDGCISVGLTVGNASISAPSVPRNLSATPAGSGAFLLWDPPATAGSGTLTDYVVQYSSNSGNTWTTYADGTSTNTYASLSGLNNGTSYLFRVAAVNTFFQTALQGLYATTTSLLIGVPAAPTNLIVTTPSTGTAGLSWTAPADNGAAITDYVIQYSTNGTSWLTFSDGVSTNTSVSVTGLTNNTSYFFRVAAKNSRGTGPYVTSTATLIGALPTAPQYVGVTALGVNPPGTGSVGSYYYILVSWNTPASSGSKPITAYRIRRYDTNSTLVETIVTANNTVRSFYSAIGTVGQRYKYTVAALTDFGVGAESPFTSAIYPYAAPAPPTNVVATTPSTRTVRLTWNVSANDGGDPAGVRGYQISAAKVVSSGSLSWFNPQNWTGTVVFDANNTAVGATTAGATITDNFSQYLLAGESYVFRVRGVNYADPGWDWGGPSDVFTAINFSDQTTAIETEPLSPNLSLTGTASGVVNLAWSPRYTSTYSGISPITNYTLQSYNVSTGVGWTTVATPPATATSASITGLTDGQTYSFRLSATNAFGTSGYSLVNATPAPPPQNAPQELIVAYPQTRQYYSDEFGTLDKSSIAVYFNSATNTLANITSSEVELSVDNGVTWQNVSVYGGGTTGSANAKGSFVTALGSCYTTIPGSYPSSSPTSVPQFLFRAASINTSGTGSRATTTIPFTPDFRPKTGRRISASLASFSNGIAAVNIDFDISTSPWLYYSIFNPEVPNYSVQYRVVGTSNWTTFTGFINNRQQTHSFIYPKFATISVPPGDYEARVAGVNNFGTGFYKHVFFSISSTGDLGYVSGLPTAGQLECSSGNSSLDLFWRNGGNATHYRILIRPYNQTGFAGYPEGYYTVATVANNVFSYTINFSSLPTAIQNALPVGTAIEVVVLPIASAIESAVYGYRQAMLAYRLEKDLPVPNASDLIGKTLFTTISCASPQTNCTLIGSYYKTTPVNTYKVPGFSVAGSFLYNDNPYNALDGVDMVVYKTETISGTTYTYAVFNTARFGSNTNPTNWAELSYYIFGTGGPAAGQSSCKVGFRYLHAHNAIKGRQVILTLSSNGQISA